MRNQLHCVESLKFQSIYVRAASVFLFQLVLQETLNEGINVELKLGSFVLFFPVWRELVEEAEVKDIALNHTPMLPVFHVLFLSKMYKLHETRCHVLYPF